MSNIWKVAIFEYRRNVFKKSFILLLLSVPVFITISIGMSVYIEATENNDLPVGYVDLAGVITDTVKLPINSDMGILERNMAVDFIAFASKSEAANALSNREIQVFYVLPSDYAQNRRVEQVYIEKPGKNAERQFYDFLQLNLLKSYPAEIAKRVALGTHVTVRSIDGRREVSSEGPKFGLLMPLFYNMAILFLILMSSSYAMSAVVDEKENRTMEVLATSTSMNRLITGKILGIIAIGLSLMLSWTLVIFGGAWFTQQIGINWFQDLSMDWGVMFTTMVIGIPAYGLAIALMTAIGAAVTSGQEGQSVSSIFIILHLVPLYVSAVLFKNPHTPIAITLSLCPFTALMTLGMRNFLTIIPSWQIIVSLVVQIACLLGALWLAGRSLRLGMLRYGQRVSLRSLFRYRT